LAHRAVNDQAQEQRAGAGKEIIGQLSFDICQFTFENHHALDTTDFMSVVYQFQPKRRGP